MKEYVAFHTLEKRILSYQRLKSLELSLPTDRFIRIHKSYIINKLHVDMILEKQVRIDQLSLPIGNTYREQVQQKFRQG